MTSLRKPDLFGTLMRRMMKKDGGMKAKKSFSLHLPKAKMPQIKLGKKRS